MSSEGRLLWTPSEAFAQNSEMARFMRWLAAERGLQRIEAGVNLSRRQAYRQMLQRGFRIDFQGVAMHKPDAPAYNRPDAFVVDDWR